MIWDKPEHFYENFLKIFFLVSESFEFNEKNVIIPGNVEIVSDISIN